MTDYSKETIRIGTLAKADRGVNYLRQINPHGFESYSLMFWEELKTLDIPRFAAEVREALAGSGAVVSTLSIFGNPLKDDAHGEFSRWAWDKLIDSCHLFGCDIVSGFAGRVPNCSIPDSLPMLKKVYGPLAKKAADRGVRLAWENCDMDGFWDNGDHNMAYCPDAWELMFNEIPDANVGLEWEPCHQLYSLIDPMPQLRKWAQKIFHVHGKDATVLWDVIRTHGIRGSKPYVYHRTPGFGDSNWTDIISELRRSGFKGSIDIEGWHDPVYSGELEMTGQVHGLNHLKQCRGGNFVPNPI
jgi:sugar phosphate isomerase/epimerase